MQKFDYDVLIIGSGPGGCEAAFTAAQAGKKTAIIERKPHLGGVSLQTGTIPSKALREAAYLRSRFAAKGMRSAAFRDPSVNNHVFLTEAIQTKNTIVEKQESMLLSELMKYGISIIPGEANFADEHTVKVYPENGKETVISAEYIILATGSRPRRPAEIPFDKEVILDSTSLLKIQRLPESLIVIGGGVIACELATMFAMLGVKIRIIDSHSQLLAYLDEDIIRNLMNHMEDMDIKIHLSENLISVRRNGNTVTAVTDKETYESAALLHAMGRQPNTEKLNLSALKNIILDNYGYIPVNENFQTAVPHIYTVGDLAGKPSLAATAMKQGRHAVSHAFQLSTAHQKIQVPMAIYTIPELSYAGSTEKELQDKNINYVSGTGEYSRTARGQIIGSNRGMLKMLADKKSKKILGIHIIGENASELIHTGLIALHFESTVQDLAGMIYNYPTLAECYRTAALECMRKCEQ